MMTRTLLGPSWQVWLPLLFWLYLFVVSHDIIQAFTFVSHKFPSPLSTSWGLCRQPQSFYAKSHNEKENHDDADDDGDDDDDENNDFFEAELPDSSREQFYPKDYIERLTVTQLKQQLRLRGLKVGGRKSDLVNRFLQHQKQHSRTAPVEEEASSSSESRETEISRARQFAAEQGKELVDVSEYVDEDDVGQDTRTKRWKARVGYDDSDDYYDEDEDEEIQKSRDPEVWGADARIVDDYEGGRLVVDCLSRSIVEFQGSNASYVQAFVVASRDALKPFLAGGRNPTNNGTTADRKGGMTPAEERLREIQTKREQAAKRPIRPEDEEGVDEGDETGIYKEALHREFSDWGVYTATGAQLSAAEVQGVLLLSDVYGAFTNYTRALAEKIAFECQPIVVMVPDLFRGNPWTGETTSTTNQDGLTYEQWRAQHSDLRVNIDIRAAAACLRERYGVSSIAVWGTCYGGGRALEAAAGWIPNRNIHDVDGRLGPPPVDAVACVAWYPTRYHLPDLFGTHHMGTIRGATTFKNRTIAVMAVFAGKDTIPGARPSDAKALKAALAADERIKDYMVKIFPDQEHGFAHQGLGQSAAGKEDDDTFGRFVDEEFGGAGQISFAEGDAEVACLLSTAFMETYSRVFLPTVGPPICLEPSEALWNNDLEMNVTASSSSKNGRRDVRKEIEESLENFVDEPLGGYMIDRHDPNQEEELIRLLRTMEGPEQKGGPYAIEDDDDLSTVYAKLKAADENFQLF